jgi:hypothetical protein
MGKLPDWYALMRAARYLGVPPWQLQEQPAAWLTWALTSEAAEMEARKLAQDGQAI